MTTNQPHPPATGRFFEFPKSDNQRVCVVCDQVIVTSMDGSWAHLWTSDGRLASDHRAQPKLAGHDDPFALLNDEEY